MKIVIDVDRLLREGRITPEQCDYLKSLALEETGSLAFNILVGFGVIATAGGFLAMAPSTELTTGVSALLAVAGSVISSRYRREWGVLGAMLLLVGSLTAAGGILALTEGSWLGFLIVTLVCGVGSVAGRSGLLASMAVLSLSATAGAMMAYEHAAYFLAIRQPTLTVFLFSAIGIGCFQLSKHLRPDFERLAIIAARTCLFVVNLGFWVGSLWGDSLTQQTNVWSFGAKALIPDLVFVIGWAVALIAVGLWAVKADRRWVVNLSAVFGAIHFYTQYFERLGPNPVAILMAGVIALGIAFALVRYNRSSRAVAAA